MKRFIAIMALILCVCLCSCNTAQGQEDLENSSSGKNTSMFIVIETTLHYQIVYHKGTKVMYAVSVGYYNAGNFTLLVNADGTPMVYGGGE